VPAIPAVVDTPTVMSTQRIGQLTGAPDPQNLPSLNPPDAGEWAGCGVTGTDLGACAKSGDRLYFFFGDTLPGDTSGGPAKPNTDLVAWTDDSELQPGGFKLHPVKDGRWFDPFTLDSGIGSLPMGQTPTGAFSYEDKVYVIALWDNPNDDKSGPTALLASKPDPGQAGTFHLEFTLSKSKFWQVGAVRVNNAEHPGLPAPDGDGVVLLGGGVGDQIYLAWMSLQPERGLVPSTIRYYTGGSSWTPAETDLTAALAHEADAVGVVPLPKHYTSVSAMWREDAGQWAVAYSLACKPDPLLPAEPVVARFAANPWGPWSDEIQIFNTCRERAYGSFMHWSGMDDLNTRIPPSEAAWGDSPGFAYGAFMMDRFTTFDLATRDLSLVYLMSTSSPYQVQVMRTVVRLPPPARTGTLSPVDTIAALASTNVTYSVPESDLLDWLNDPDTPYPALAQGLLTLMQPKRLNQPVSIDVIRGYYEDNLGQPSPRSLDAVNMDALKTAVLEASNENNGTNFTDFQALLA
jgi:hypothetical protein